MGLLDRLFGGGGGGNRLRPVLATHPELGPVVTSLTAKLDVTPARRVFEASRGRWHRRWLVVDAVGEHYVAKLAEAQRAAMLDAWVVKTPGDPLAYLARAQYHVDEAWKARGRGAASAVAPEAMSRFERHMRATTADLERAAELDPGDPTPHYVLMSTAPGIHADRDAAREAVVRHHREVVARAADHHAAHRRLVFLMSERWYGSHRESVELAKQLSATAPEGSELPLLVLSAHEYARSYLHFFTEDAAAAKAYTRRLEVDQDIDAAYARSLGSPRHQASDFTPYRRHEAALWFWVTGDRTRAKVELDKVGDAFDPDADPWHVSEEQYKAIRKAVGL